MPKQLIKPSRDEDFYVEWSSVVEAPTAFGPREWLTEYLMRPFAPTDSERYEFERGQVDKRFDRADATGTSAQIGRAHV